MAFAPELAVAIDQFDAAVERARHQGVGEEMTGLLLGGEPAQMEAATRGPVAKSVSALLAHAGGPGGVLHHPALAERFEKDALALRRPAIMARGLAIAYLRRGRRRRRGVGEAV